MTKMDSPQKKPDLLQINSNYCPDNNCLKFCEINFPNVSFIAARLFGRHIELTITLTKSYENASERPIGRAPNKFHTLIRFWFQWTFDVSLTKATIIEEVFAFKFTIYLLSPDSHNRNQPNIIL